MERIYIENTHVYGIEDALRAMRNPKSNRHLSAPEKDRKLSQSLYRAGPSHRKHLRFITVIADFVLPRFVWTEVDSYKVGVTRLSESTMHTLGDRDLTLDDFSFDSEIGWLMEKRIREINIHIWAYRQEKDPAEKFRIKRQIKQLLPESFLQLATVSFTGEALANIYDQRKDHPNPEWHEICKWIESLPESWMITGKEPPENVTI